MGGSVLLNNVDHADLRVVLERGAAWGDAVNQATVFATEFEDLQREYAIVFRCDPAGAFRATVLLGFDRDENLYLDGDRWDARYIPALLQRGPFSIGLPADGDAGEPMIHVDPDHPRVRSGGDAGEAVFLAHGGNSGFLDAIARVLQRIYAGHEANAPMFRAFEALGLLEPVTLDIALGEERHVSVPDCWTISDVRLAALGADDLHRLHVAGLLAPAIWARSSLANLGRLIDAKQRREATR